MSKLYMLAFCMMVLNVFSYGQPLYEIKGFVADENNNGLAGAYIFLYPVNEVTITDDKGFFTINNISKGIYEIQISFIGYKTFIDTLALNENKIYNVQLRVSALDLQEITVTGNYTENRKKEESLNIEIINDEYLKQNLGGSLMNSLERLPGITTIEIGSGQSKPVIRGLGFNRIVVVENNIKHEAQQWGTDHGLEIDQYAVDNIEIIKGPSSLIYGSDAIGGVIDLRNKKVPSINSLGGTVDLSGKTNNDLTGTSIYLFGRKERFFADIRATILDYGDYKVPADSVDIYSYKAALYKNHLRNTAGNEKNLHLSLGMIRKDYYSKIYISSVNGKSGFFANAHGLEPRNVDTFLHDRSNRDINDPFQTYNHFKIISSNQYIREQIVLEYDMGFQYNFRQEWSIYVSHGQMPSVFPDTLTFPADLERQFEKFVYSGNLKLNYKLTEKTKFITGINSEYQDNRIDGRSFIIPAYNQFSLGCYFIIKYAVSEKSLFQSGVRYDNGYINTMEYYDWFPSIVRTDEDTTIYNLKRAVDINRSFSNFSWSLGYNFNPGKWSLKANIGKSFRMPAAKELAANGVDYHMYRYTVGNKDLLPEISYQLDAGAGYNSERFEIGTTPFLNYFSNYLYLNPTSEHNSNEGAGQQVFYYTQSRIFRYGAEINARYKIIKSLQLGIIGEYVYSEQLSGEKKGFTLPFSPPPSVILNIKYQVQKIRFIQNAYVSFDYRITASQKNIVPPEEITEGYQVINISAGNDIKMKDQMISVSIQVHNLLNVSYLNHTSYYRLINVPEPGRNFILNISMPFLGKMKQK